MAPEGPSGEFTGWRPEAFEFYEELEADNTRWFWQTHRSTYDHEVRAPFLALSDAVAAEFGPLHLFRPHRDVRFSRDKSPYKTQQGAVTEGPGGEIHYVQLSADALFVGGGYHQMTPDQLRRFRSAVDDDGTGPELEAIVSDLRGRGYAIGGSALKTAPRGYPRDHERIRLLRHKGLTMGREFEPAPWMGTSGALDRIVAVWRDSRPMAGWLNTHVGPPEEKPPEEF